MVTTRFQAKKKLIDLQLKDLDIEKSITVKQLKLLVFKYNLSIIQSLAKTKHTYNQNRKNKIINGKKSRRTLDIKNIIKKVQKKVHKKKKEKNAI